MTERLPMRLPLSERDWQALVVDAARLHGWTTYHTYDSRRSAPGWPDLTLIRPPELVMVELKTDRGRLSREQEATLERLAGCGIETHVWRPCDEPEVLARLARRRVQPGRVHVLPAGGVTEIPEALGGPVAGRPPSPVSDRINATAATIRARERSTEQDTTISLAEPTRRQEAVGRPTPEQE